MSASGAGREVVVIPTGVANVASMVAALERLGADVEVSDAPRRVERAGHVVLPGVGAFGAGADFLEEHGLADPLRARARVGRPLLAVCLGMQLLFEESEESPGRRGLGVVPGVVTRFPRGMVVPHMGWNRVEAEQVPALRAGYAYFANSYRVQSAPSGWAAAWTDYGGRFVAAMQRGALVGCQFHPELSGGWGLELLRGWLTQAEDRPSPAAEDSSC